MSLAGNIPLHFTLARYVLAVSQNGTSRIKGLTPPIGAFKQREK
jgi:hypothetical protein